MENNDASVSVTLKSSDGHIFKVDKQVAIQSYVKKNMIDCLGDDKLGFEVVPLDVSSQVLQKMIEYCEYHLQNSSQQPGLIKAWDRNFIRNVDSILLLDLMKAADMLAVESPTTTQNTAMSPMDLSKSEQATTIVQSLNQWKRLITWERMKKPVEMHKERSEFSCQQLTTDGNF